MVVYVLKEIPQGTYPYRGFAAELDIYGVFFAGLVILGYIENNILAALEMPVVSPYNYPSALGNAYPRGIGDMNRLLVFLHRLGSRCGNRLRLLYRRRLRLFGNGNVIFFLRFFGDILKTVVNKYDRTV